MPVFIAALLGGLVQAAGTLVGRILISLGITYVTFTGVHASIGWVTGYFLDQLQSLPPHVVQLAGTLKIGVCISILTSAVAARLLLSGLTASGSITKMVQQ